VDNYRTAHEMHAVAGGGQLQHQVFEGDGIFERYCRCGAPAHVCSIAAAQCDAGQFNEGAFRLRRFDGEAAIEIGDELLREIVIGEGLIADGVMPEFLRQSSLNGAEGAFTAAPSLG